MSQRGRSRLASAAVKASARASSRAVAVALFVTGLALLAAIVLTPRGEASGRAIPIGLSNVNNQAMTSARYVYAIRFVAPRTTPVHRFISGFNLEGTDAVSGRPGYSGGTGGIIRARLVEVGARGEPMLDRVIAEDHAPAVRRFYASKTAYGVPSRTTQLLYFDVGGRVLQGGRMYAMTYQNMALRPGRNWFSTNSPTTRASTAGPNGRNNLDPTAAGAIAGLDPREAVGWSTDRGRSWVWGRRVGQGPTRGAYAGSRRGDQGVRLPWYGWQPAPRTRAESPQPLYAYGRRGRFRLRMRGTPRAVTLREAGGYAPVGRAVGRVTVRNLRTKATGRTARLGSGIARGPLDRPVPLRAGDPYEITHTGTVFKAEADAFIRATFGVGGPSWPYSTAGHGADRAELFALPHPWFAAGR